MHFNQNFAFNLVNIPQSAVFSRRFASQDFKTSLPRLKIQYLYKSAFSFETWLVMIVLKILLA